MSISATCPECFAEFAVPGSFAGRKIKCKSCGAAIPVPAAGGADRADPDDDFGPAGDDFGPAFAPPALPDRGAAGPSVRQPASRPRAGRSSSVWPWVAGIAGVAALAMLACCGGAAVWWRNAATSVDLAEYPNLPDFGPPTAEYPVAAIPVPKFPELGPGRPAGEQGVLTYMVHLESMAGNAGAPGMKMSMRVYLPPGDLAAGSIPCVLVAPAGATPLTGMGLDAANYHDETLPYAEAGMAVVHYSVDGPLDAAEDIAAFKAAYLRFRAAGAGTVNTRNALEFALAKLPMVDPKQVFAAGHSSAGTLSLLAAAHEPRLAGALAYAPAADIEARMKETDEVPELLTGLFVPRMKEFLTQSSPMTHVGAVACPVFLYHSKADENTAFADSERFAEKARAAGKDVTFVAGEPPAGGAGDGAVSEAQAAAERAAAEESRELALQPPGFDLDGGDAADAGDPETEAGDEPSDGEESETDEEIDMEAPAAEGETEDDDWEAEPTEDTGVHYSSMIGEGLPKGIEWIKARTGR